MRQEGVAPEARATFQATYGPLIYTFHVRVFHLSEDAAGDFYLYAFERDRIFKRIRSFEGRNAIQFETYLSYYVLGDLVLEWVWTNETVNTMSLDAPMGPVVYGGPGANILHDHLATRKILLQPPNLQNLRNGHLVQTGRQAQKPLEDA